MTEDNPFSRFLEGEISMEELQHEVKCSQTSWSPQATNNNLDRALFGRWKYSDLISSGGMSVMIEIYLVLGGDGGFIKSSQSFGGTTVVDVYGNWVGTSSLQSVVGSGDRGHWIAENPNLTLNFDNNTYIAYQYECSGDSLLLYHDAGNQYYKRA